MFRICRSLGGTLYKLTKPDDKTFARALEAGAIHAKMERREVLGLRDERGRRSLETAPLFGTCTTRELEVLVCWGNEIERSLFDQQETVKEFC